MTGSYFRGDAVPVLAPQDEAKFDTVTYTYYEQLNGYEYLKQLDIGYFFYSGSYANDILNVAGPGGENHRPHSQRQFAREHEDKIREVEHIIDELGEWQRIDPATGFQLVNSAPNRSAFYPLEPTPLQWHPVSASNHLHYVSDATSRTENPGVGGSIPSLPTSFF